ncbi:hypothetical protein BHE74_00008998 [Ensete ventricosum]|nr:hypothetical protein BHE74_00008998 [Ensete ventricosum]
MNRQHLSSLAWLVEATGATAFDLVIVIIFSNGSTFSILVLVIASCGIVMANVTGALTLEATSVALNPKGPVEKWIPLRWEPQNSICCANLKNGTTPSAEDGTDDAETNDGRRREKPEEDRAATARFDAEAATEEDLRIKKFIVSGSKPQKKEGPGGRNPRRVTRVLGNERQEREGIYRGVAAKVDRSGAVEAKALVLISDGRD